MDPYKNSYSQGKMTSYRARFCLLVPSMKIIMNAAYMSLELPEDKRQQISKVFTYVMLYRSTSVLVVYMQFDILQHDIILQYQYILVLVRRTKRCVVHGPPVLPPKAHRLTAPGRYIQLCRSKSRIVDRFIHSE